MFFMSFVLVALLSWADFLHFKGGNPEGVGDLPQAQQMGVPGAREACRSDSTSSALGAEASSHPPGLLERIPNGSQSASSQKAGGLGGDDPWEEWHLPSQCHCAYTSSFSAFSAWSAEQVF